MLARKPAAKSFLQTVYERFITKEMRHTFITDIMLKKLHSPRRFPCDISCIVCSQKHTSFLPLKILPCFCTIKEAILARKGINKQKQISDLCGTCSPNTFIYSSLQVKKLLQIAFCEHVLAVTFPLISFSREQITEERETVLPQPAQLGMAQPSPVHTSLQKHQTLDCVKVAWSRATMFLIASLFICTHILLTLFFSTSSLQLHKQH